MAGNCRGRGVARPRALLPRPHTRTHHPFSLHPHLPVRPPPPAARTPSSLCRTCVEFFLEREREKEGETLAAEKCAEGQKKKAAQAAPRSPLWGGTPRPSSPNGRGGSYELCRHARSAGTLHRHTHTSRTPPPNPPTHPPPFFLSSSQGCGCDPGILSLISAANADADTLSGAVRLAQTSKCAAEGPAGWANPCPGAKSCLTVT